MRVVCTCARVCVRAYVRVGACMRAFTFASIVTMYVYSVIHPSRIASRFQTSLIQSSLSKSRVTNIAV